MTLKFRNHFFVLLFVISLCCIVTAAVVFAMAVAANAITPPTGYRLPHLMTRLPLTGYHFTATMLSITFLVLYVPVTVFILLRAFENTQTSEIIFFAGFLLSCLCEGIRVLIPLFAVGQSFSQLQLFCGRILFTGRLIAPLSLVGAAILSSLDQRQDIERNFLIIITISTLSALVVPLNTAQITTACAITWGFSRLFLTVRLCLFVIAIISFWLNGFWHENRELQRIALATVFVCCGYLFLTVADNFLFLGLGLMLLAAGTYKLLSTLHKLYMWN